MAAIAFWISLLATILTLISLILDIIALMSVRNGMKNVPSQTIPGTGSFFPFSKCLIPVSNTLTSEYLGLWLNVVTVGLLILASFMQHRLNIIADRQKLRRTTIIQEHRV